MGGFRRDSDGVRRPVSIPRDAVGISHSDGRHTNLGCITSRRTHIMAPAYEMTPEEANRYGASLNIWQQIQLLTTWSPLISYGQRFLNERDAYKRSLIVAEALEWLAAKTDAKLDDELTKLMSDILRTPQGEAMVMWALAKVALVK